MTDINVVIANNSHDPIFAEMAKRLRDEFGITQYLGDDYELYDYSEESQLSGNSYFGLYKSGDIYRLAEWDPGSAHNDFFM